MPWPRRMFLVRCEQAARNILGRRGMRIFLEKMVLDFPGVVDAELVGELDLIERLLKQPVLVTLVPRPRQLVLVENAEFHGRSTLLFLHYLSENRAHPASSAGQAFSRSCTSL